VAKEWEEALGIARIGITDDLLELGASSLAIAQLWQRIQSSFQVSIPLTALFQSRTVEQFSALLQAHEPAVATVATSSLAAIQPYGQRPPLFLCEGVGLYYPLTPYLGQDQPVYGLVTPVSESYPRVEDLAAHYIEEIRTIQPEGPYFLGGASFGGLVAFETAQQLSAGGHRVAFLALFDTPAPGASTPRSFRSKWIGHLSNLGRFGLPYLRGKAYRAYRRLPAILRAIRRRVARPRAAAAHIAQGTELRDFFQGRASRYEVKPYAGRVTLFSLAQRDGNTDTMFDPAIVEIDPLLGWGRVAAEGVELHEVPGGHVSIFQPPFVQVLAERLRASLLKAQAQAQDT
jgi:thioesterase domain-containing protein/acyl carrier protein